jgi:hypothetical protein
MWRIGLTSGWEYDQHLYSTTKPNEFAAIMSNLRRYFGLLKASRSSSAVEAAYLRREASGIVALTTQGFDGADEMNLYTFAEEPKRILHLLGIGKPDTRESDMLYCKNLVFYITNENQQTKTSTEGKK